MSIEVGATNKKGILAELMRLKRILEKIKHKLRKEHIVVIHHTGTDRDYTRFESIDGYHRSVGYDESELGYNCAYNILITGDGEEHRARKLSEDGEAVHSLDEFHTDLALTGNFMEEVPSEAQKDTLRAVLSDIREHFSNQKVIIRPHRNYTPTLCPGENLCDLIPEL